MPFGLDETKLPPELAEYHGIPGLQSLLSALVRQHERPTEYAASAPPRYAPMGCVAFLGACALVIAVLSYFVTYSASGAGIVAAGVLATVVVFCLFLLLIRQSYRRADSVARQPPDVSSLKFAKRFVEELFDES